MEEEEEEEEEEEDDEEEEEMEGEVPVSSPLMLPAARGGGGGGVSVVETVAAALRRSLLLCSSVRAAEDEGAAAAAAAAAGMQIGRPTDERHVSHVTFDRFVGFLGLPADLEPDVPRPAPSARAVPRHCLASPSPCSVDLRRGLWNWGSAPEISICGATTCVD